MKNKAKLLLVPLMVLMATGCQGKANSKLSGENQIVIDTVVDNKGLTMRQIASGIDNNGYEYMEIEYTVLPENASNKAVFTTLSWVSSDVTDDIDSYLTTSVNDSNSTIKVTAKQSFSNQANMKITCVANRDVYANVTIDYIRKPTGILTKSAYIFYNEIKDDSDAWDAHSISGYNYVYNDGSFESSLAYLGSSYSGQWESKTALNTGAFNRECYSLQYSNGTKILQEDVLWRDDVEISLVSAAPSAEYGGVYYLFNGNPTYTPMNNTALNTKVKNFLATFLSTNWNTDIKVADVYRACRAYAETLTSSESAEINGYTSVGSIVDITVQYDISLQSGKTFTAQQTHSYWFNVPGSWFYIDVASLTTESVQIEF